MWSGNVSPIIWMQGHFSLIIWRPASSFLESGGLEGEKMATRRGLILFEVQGTFLDFVLVVIRLIFSFNPQLTQITRIILI